MVAAQWGEGRDAGTRTGGGVAGRFRPLGSAGEAPDTTPPPFGTAPWGYRRSEVDAWASWVAGLVAHGRNETVRADSAEATLRATLERLERLERPEQPDPDAEPDPSPAPPPAGPRAAGRLHFAAPTDLPRRTGRVAADTPDGTARPPAPEVGAPPDPGLARLHVVETTLHEVLGLLHHLADHDRPTTGT